MRGPLRWAFLYLMLWRMYVYCKFLALLCVKGMRTGRGFQIGRPPPLPSRPCRVKTISVGSHRIVYSL